MTYFDGIIMADFILYFSEKMMISGLPQRHRGIKNRVKQVGLGLVLLFTNFFHMIIMKNDLFPHSLYEFSAKNNERRIQVKKGPFFTSIRRSIVSAMIFFTDFIINVKHNFLNRHCFFDWSNLNRLFLNLNNL